MTDLTCPKCKGHDTFVRDRNAFGAGTGTCTKMGCHHTWPVPETVPEVGMGVTMGAGSDCYPYTIIEVAASKKSFVIQEDNHTPDEHHDGRLGGHQSYTYSRNPNGTVLQILRSPRGWVIKGSGGRRVHLGSRRYYQDPHF